MRYFMVENDSCFIDIPVLKDWSGKIDPRNIKKGLTGKLPKRQLINVYPNEKLMFPGIITRPFPLFSREVKAVANSFQSGIIYKEIVLLDGENGHTELYYLAVLPEPDCLHKSSEMNTASLVRPTLKYGTIGEHSLFRISGSFGTRIIMRINLAEALLQRDVRGLKLTEIVLTMEGSDENVRQI